MHEHGSAIFGEAASNGGTDAAGSTGDEGEFILEREHDVEDEKNGVVMASKLAVHRGHAGTAMLLRSPAKG